MAGRGCTIGVISDTHGVVPPEALAALAGVDHVIHAGDIGSPEVLWALQGVAPVTAVRGNNDRDQWARDLPDTAAVELGGALLYVLHDVHDLDLDPGAAGFAAVLAGHTHAPSSATRQGVLYFNPGAAGRRRFDLPLSVGLLTVGGGRIQAEHVVIDG